ncbi:MAG: OmpH family outer membrane protein [Bacteroidota bacterium]|jgi:outer membrane protein
MKNLSLIINGILAIAVVILFYQVNGLKNKNSDESIKQGIAEEEKPLVINSSTNLVDAKIAYINTDSINEHYAYIADFTKVLKSKKASIESQMQILTSKFQKDYESFQQSAQAGIASEADLIKQKTNLERQQQEIANKELQMQNLGIELEEKNIELNKNVKNFLQKYNKGKFDYVLSYSDMMPTLLLVNPKLDITKDILKGINDEYKSKK